MYVCDLSSVVNTDYKLLNSAHDLPGVIVVCEKCMITDSMSNCAC